MKWGEARRGLNIGQKERGREEISQEMGLRKSVEKVKCWTNG